jgi:hypothetical protein
VVGSCRPRNGKVAGEETGRAVPRASVRGNANLERGCYCPHITLLKQKANYNARVKPKKVNSGGHDRFFSLILEQRARNVNKHSRLHFE